MTLIVENFGVEMVFGLEEGERGCSRREKRSIGLKWEETRKCPIWDYITEGIIKHQFTLKANFY